MHVMISKFDLSGSCERGFSCDDLHLLHKFDDNFEGVQRRIESMIKVNADSFQPLPITEEGSCIHYHSSKCLRLDWDDNFAEIVCSVKCVTVGLAYISE